MLTRECVAAIKMLEVLRETTKILLCWTQICVSVIDHESIFMLNIRMYCSHRSCNAGYKTVLQPLIMKIEDVFKLNTSICTAATDQIMLSTILYCSNRL